MNAIHAQECRLGKNARLVAVAIGWRMGRKSEAWPGLPSIMKEAHMSRSVAIEALNDDSMPAPKPPAIPAGLVVGGMFGLFAGVLKRLFGKRG